MTEPVGLSSWYRSPARNLEVGGAERSQHLYGTALDLVGPGAKDAAKQLRARGWTALNEGDHWHVQVFASNPFPRM